MDNLQKYGSTIMCPACGGLKFDDKFYENVTIITRGGEVIRSVGEVQDLIARTCTNCGRTISEIPLSFD